MNYYPHHIGDFNSATRHLTRTERSVYRDLLEVYYDTETQLNADLNKLCRLVLAHTDEERTAVEQVLNEFFTQTEQGWMHARCEIEIARYHGNKEAKSAAGKASAAKRSQKSKQNHNTASSVNEQESNTSSTAVDVSLPACATNQNQNQNQNQINTSSLRSDSASDEKKEAEDVPPEKPNPPPPTALAQACVGMKQAGLSDLNTSSPVLRKMIEEGVTTGEFVDAAREAVTRGRGFAYALKIVEGRRNDAAKLVLAPARKIPAPDNFTARDYGTGVQLV